MMSLRAFLLLSFTISTIAAGGVAHRVLNMGTSFFAFKYVIAAVVAVILLLFVGPVVVFGWQAH